MNKLYHLTAGVNVQSIIREGLIPNRVKGLTSRRDAKPVVWLTNNANWIAENQAGITWIKMHNPYVLTVNVEPYKDVLQAKISFAKEVPCVCVHEFYVTCPIESAHILSYEVFVV